MMAWIWSGLISAGNLPASCKSMMNFFIDCPPALLTNGAEIDIASDSLCRSESTANLFDSLPV